MSDFTAKPQDQNLLALERVIRAPVIHIVTETRNNESQLLKVIHIETHFGGLKSGNMAAVGKIPQVSSFNLLTWKTTNMV